jgi:hypothetical protein
MGQSETIRVRGGAGGRWGALRSGSGSRWLDVIGLTWVALAAVAVLVPALWHGGSLGAYDILGQFGLTAHRGVVHDGLVIDQIDQMIPWSVLSWTQVHHGQIPLWNPYSALGMPLAFNWQSSAFSVPALISYALPLRYVYTSQVLATLIVAGSGAYVFGRVLRLRILACVFLGVAFELSGPFFAWVGWPIASVASWTGWILAGLVLVLRGRHRIRYVVLTGAAVACSVYAGQPDALILLGGACALFVVLALAVTTWRERRIGALVRPAVDIGAAGLLGLLLSAPLLLPGLQLVSSSVRSTGNAGVLNAGHAHDPTQLLNQYALGLLRLPNLVDSQYAGIVAVVLAIGAAIVARRREHVLPLVVLAVGALAVAYFNPVTVAVNALPGLHAVRLPRVNLILAFATAALGAVGLHVLTRTERSRAIRFFGALFGIGGCVLVVIWVSGHGASNGIVVPTTASYVWVAAGIVVGFAATAASLTVLRSAAVRTLPPPEVATIAVADRGQTAGTGVRTLAAGVIVLFETVFLVVVGSQLWTAVPNVTPSIPAAVQLKQIVGTGLVGLGEPDCLQTPAALGISPNANILFGVRQLAVYDPLLPRNYYSSWQQVTGQVAGYSLASLYCPAVTSVAEARLYGVAYILEHAGSPGPVGTVRVATVAGEGVYRVPGAAPATVVPRGPGPPLPSIGTTGSPVPVRSLDPGTWEVHTGGASAEVLRLRLTDVPGWRATLDGHSLALAPFAGIMLQAVVPAGPHTVTVSYWPPRFTLGLELAAVGVVASVGMVLLGRARRRSRRAPGSVAPGAGAG